MASNDNSKPVFQAFQQPSGSSKKARKTKGAREEPSEEVREVVLPPLYPAAQKPSDLIPEPGLVKVYNNLSQFFRSNYSLEPAAKEKSGSGFYVGRYTDQYKSPLASKPHLLHFLPDSRFPAELSSKSVPNKAVMPRRQERKVKDFPGSKDADNVEDCVEAEATGTVPKKPVGSDDESDGGGDKDEEAVKDVDEVTFQFKFN